MSKILELLLPSSTQGAVQLHQRESFVEYGLRQVQARGEITRIAVQHFEITRRAAGIARIREMRSIFGSLGKQLLLLPEFLVFCVSHQRVRNFTKRQLDGLPIKQCCFLLLRFRQSYAGANSATLKNRLCKLGARIPETALHGEEIGQ